MKHCQISIVEFEEGDYNNSFKDKPFSWHLFFSQNGVVNAEERFETLESCLHSAIDTFNTINNEHLIDECRMREDDNPIKTFK